MSLLARIDGLLAQPHQEIAQCERIFGATLSLLHFFTPEGLRHPDRLRLISMQKCLADNDAQGWREMAAEIRVVLTHLRSDYQQRCLASP